METSPALVAAKSRQPRATYERKSHGRTRVSNRHDILPDVDGRSLLARRYKDIANAIAVDLGGADRLSEAKLQLVRRFSAAAVLAEALEAKLVRGEQIDITEHALLCSTLTRLVQRIGVDRIPREITPSLETYLQQQHRPREVSE
jgi:hypothetical protein